MILKIFTVYDSKVEAYMTPFFERSSGSAIRGFEQTCLDGKSSFSLYASDYTLFEIGTYDDETGMVEAYPSFISLGNGIEFAPPPEV